MQKLLPAHINTHIHESLRTPGTSFTTMVQV